MKLKFNNKYLSIESINSVDLPDFTLLTGVNGSGKSHLMEALEKQHVSVSGMENSNIVLFNYENFRLDNEQSFNAQMLYQERESAWKYYEQHIRNKAQQWKTHLGSDYDDLKHECESENTGFLRLDNEGNQKYKAHFNSYFSLPHIRNNPQAQGIYSLAQNLHYTIDEIDHDEFMHMYKPYLLKKDFLPHQLGKVFWDYYVKYISNQVNEFQNEKYGKSYDALTESEFIAKHGEKPWDIVNQILETFDTLQYRVNSPEGSDYFGNFQLRLVHTEKEKLEIEFNHLSSGERVLMALVASVYKSSSDRNFPDLLLLDEVDSSLHPAMMQNMLDVISNIFLKQGVKIILVTHSPTTVALAPEESIFIMNKSGSNRIEKKTKQAALSILTQGYATLEHGLLLFNEVTNHPITIITEGYNYLLISKALDLYGVKDVGVLSGIEGISGKNQLKTLFQFFSKTRHASKVLFVWDCDVNYRLIQEANTFPFVIPKNDKNKIAQKGIENAFPEKLFSAFTKTITRSNRPAIVEFDETRKLDFARYVLERNKKSDFKSFSALIAEVKRISKL